MAPRDGGEKVSRPNEGRGGNRRREIAPARERRTVSFRPRRGRQSREEKSRQTDGARGCISFDHRPASGLEYAQRWTSAMLS